MELTSVISLFAGLTLIISGIFWGGGQIQAFVALSSIAITLGGTAAATFVSYAPKEISVFIKTIRRVFQFRASDMDDTVQAVLSLSSIARKEGLVALEEAAKYVDDRFLRKGILLVVDGAEPEQVLTAMQAEINYEKSLTEKATVFIESLASCAPAFGMLGTLVGVITMLRNISDPVSLCAGLATALISTFYGVLLAHLFFYPLAAKLKNKSADKELFKKLVLEGVLSVQAGENPRMIEEKLFSFIRPAPELGKAAIDD